jgi:hypothetical protein
VTVYVVSVVKNGVVNEPVVPVPPPPDEVHEVLSVEDQETVAVAPLAIEVGDAERVTTGAGSPTVTVVPWLAVPPRPLHETV